MRLPRVRFTVRRMMAVVAVAAVTFAVARPVFYRWRASTHWERAAYWSRRAGGMPICKLAFTELSSDRLHDSIENAPIDPSRKACLHSAINHWLQALEYETAASSWMPCLTQWRN
jgi:hypothetical protein